MFTSWRCSHNAPVWKIQYFREYNLFPAHKWDSTDGQFIQAGKKRSRNDLQFCWNFDGADHSALRPEQVLNGCRILNHSAWTVGGGSLIGTTNGVFHKTIWYAASVAGFHMMNNTLANKWSYLRGTGVARLRMEYSLVKNYLFASYTGYFD